MGTTIANATVVVATIAAATAAVWHGSIDGATFAAIITGALGIGGVTHVRTANGNGSSSGTTNG